ncbi:protein of unknown function (DUF4586), putative [Trypanosoma equiperdum]|uniref:Uncharacterized protein n=3 Tax=Trypanozoon TaxID=39700 RepID=Q57V66_TRYB2|nr:hypothetical protein, conserved [Trypanosoma brucei brucei TREU927]AAX70503.1 hypothetical protein, conserved [Trypanosoma brucei]AAZ10354.1 hypothetical protein, conserved [Trypanosoma brucei brucei TREU927]SCU68105.1 Domain of unknown function (DUF4586), putative [Trypanosoma equiperdum]
MTHLSAFGGLFSDPPLVSTDIDPKKTDPYDKMDTIPSRYLGKGMSIGRCPSGNGPEVFFDKKFLTLASAEQNNNKSVGPFEDATTRMHRERREAKKHNISNKDFLPPSFPKSINGPGGYSGCFQERPYEFIMPGEEGGPKSKKSKRKKKASSSEEDSKGKELLPNIKTNPSKKGTYGYVGILLDNPKYNDDWRKEHEKLEAAEAKKRKKLAPPKPLGPLFRTPGVIHDYLDELPATGVSGVYHFEPADEKPSKRKRKNKQEAAGPTFVQERAMTFVWTRSGNEGNIDPFPNTWIDVAALEEEEKKKNRRRRRAKAKDTYVPGPPKGATGVWKPNTFECTSVVQSCLRRFY